MLFSNVYSGSELLWGFFCRPNVQFVQNEECIEGYYDKIQTEQFTEAAKPSEIRLLVLSLD